MDLIQQNDRIRMSIGRLLLSEGLRAKVMRGGAWLGAGSVSEQAARFVRNMLLARLLAPGAFGTMAIVMSCSSLLGSLTDIGLKGAIMQNPRGAEDSYLSASWWMGMGRALCLYATGFAVAPWISHFYGVAELSALLRVALLSTLLEGALSPRSALPQKTMKFPRWAAITNGGAICGVILTITLSFFLRDVWALAIGTCSENAFRLLLSYALCPGLPSRHWDWHAARELLAFSRGVFGLGFLNLIIGRTDIFILGRLYPPATLGLYAMAVSLVMAPSAFFNNMLGTALMPAACSVQADSERLNRILVEVTSWLTLLGLPAALCISLCAPSLLRVAYGARYIAAAGPLSIAAAVVCLTVLNGPLSCVIIARGRPAVHRQAVAAMAATMLIAIYPACRLFGPTGAQVAALLAIAVGYLFQLVRVRVLTDLNVLKYARTFFPAALGSAGILGVVLASHQLGLVTRPIPSIALCVGSCLIVYAVSAFTLLRPLLSRQGLYCVQTPASEAVL